MTRGYEWWQARGDELRGLAAGALPLYVYDEETVNEVFFDLLSMPSVDGLFYDAGVNDHPRVLTRLVEQGVGFKCGSVALIESLRRRFPRAARSLFQCSPQLAGPEAYRNALGLGARVVLNGLDPLGDWAEVFCGQEIFIRVEMLVPGDVSERGPRGGAGAGVPLSRLEALRGSLRQMGTAVAGICLGPKAASREPCPPEAIVGALAEALAYFPEASTVCLSEELGTVCEAGRGGPNLSATAERLEEIRESCRGPALWLETGEGVMSSAGVLLTRAARVFSREGLRHVAVEEGTSTLLRSAALGLCRPIVNLTRPEDGERERVRFVDIREGRDALPAAICRVPPVEEGDILLLANAGSRPSAGPGRAGPRNEVCLPARRVCQVKL